MNRCQKRHLFDDWLSLSLCCVSRVGQAACDCTIPDNQQVNTGRLMQNSTVWFKSPLPELYHTNHQIMLHVSDLILYSSCFFPSILFASKTKQQPHFSDLTGVIELQSRLLGILGLTPPQYR